MSGGIAVVGMSGRFPGAPGVDSFLGEHSSGDRIDCPVLRCPACRCRHRPVGNGPPEIRQRGRCARGD